MGAGDVTMHVPLTQAMFIETTHGFAPGIETWNDFALHVHDLLPTVDPQATVGIVPDNHD